MRHLTWLLAIGVTTGCTGGTRADCLPNEQIAAWVDADGDGYGSGEVQRVCALSGNLVERPLDCNDADAAVHPEAEETCNGVDDDCDGELDDGFEPRTWYTDADEDGFGTQYPAMSACGRPAGSWVRNADDCDDTDPDVSPYGVEVCNEGVDDDCDGLADDADPSVDPDSMLDGWRDFDGDGYGDPAAQTLFCGEYGSFVDNADDCDDGRADVHPGGQETCNRLDDDCDGQTDDADPSVDPSSQEQMWADVDGDGFGDPDVQVMACRPIPGLAADNADDCDDARAAVNPGRPEVLCDGQDNDCTAVTTDDVDLDGDGFTACVSDCDDGSAAVNPGEVESCNFIDDDCDDRIDDADPSVDPATQVELYADLDGDGFGNGAQVVLACRPIPGIASANADDCDDTRASIHPNRPEVLCDGYDNDCDAASTDDVDTDHDGYTRCVDDCADQRPDVNPGATEIPDDHFDQNCNLLEACYLDADQDGARTDTWVEVADSQCDDPGHGKAGFPVDCDDQDPAVNVDVDWVEDLDGDGFGAGPVVITSCLDPGPGLVPVTPELDCDDGDETVNPGAFDACYDGFDVDCDTLDTCRSCEHWRLTDPLAGDGVYAIEPTAGVFADVWCDMTTDGGGWTLVASTSGLTLNDAGGNWYTDLTTLTPASGHETVWRGMRDVIASRAHDVRFACKLDPVDVVMEVDLSFYDVPWYDIITTGVTDAASCFNESDGFGQTPQVPPARRDNVSGATRARGNQWNYGYLEGEDVCSSPDDFTIDFDNRGMDSNEGDGTDWGEDDNFQKCGSAVAPNGAWFIFVRE